MCVWCVCVCVVFSGCYSDVFMYLYPDTNTVHVYVPYSTVYVHRVYHVQYMYVPHVLTLRYVYVL